jgi:hypothetical protein
MPDTCYRELAGQDPWLSVADVEIRTGESPHHLVAAQKAGATGERCTDPTGT